MRQCDHEATLQVQQNAKRWPPKNEKLWNTVTCPVRIPLRVLATPLELPFILFWPTGNMSDTPLADFVLAREWEYKDGAFKRQRYVLIPWPCRFK